jgi:glycosyltransferase involved in cell wall biosynthesis
MRAHDLIGMSVAALAHPSTWPPYVDITIPVYNEERDLAPAVRRLYKCLSNDFPFSAQITIADNASTDGTVAQALRLAAELPGVRLIRINEKGRGRALAASWLTSDAQVVAYMDVDLSTDLSALLPLIAPVISGHSDVSIGSRLASGARVVRSTKRELISRCYNLLLRVVLGVRFKDAQCGFKAVRADVARRLVPTVQNRNWFFDTELLVQAERAGLRVHELPVDWIEDPDSRVDILATAIEDLRGVWRLATGRRVEASPARLRGQLVRFAGIGVTSTLAYAALYWILRGFLPPIASNTAALVVTAIANTAANRRLTFGVRGAQGLLRDHAGGLVAFAVALVLTNGAIGAMQLVKPAPSLALEIATLSAANVCATIVRFLLLRLLLVHLRSDGTPEALRIHAP